VLLFSVGGELKLNRLLGAGQGKYFDLNSGLDLYKNINKYTGVRYLVEIIFLRVSRLILGRVASADPVFSRFEVFRRELSGVQRGFFLDTSWYKDTFFIGSVATENEKLFVKYFMFSGLAKAESDNCKKISKIYGSYYSFSESKLISDCILVCPLIENSGGQSNYHYMFYSALAYYGSLEKGLNRRSLKELCLAVLSELGGIDKLPDLAAGIEENLDRMSLSDDSLEVCFCHGDYTTWNTVVSDKGTLFLVDFEHCAEKVLFSDVFHLATQKSFLEDRKVDIVALIDEVSLAANESAEFILGYFKGFILEQLCCDLHEWARGKQHEQLNNLIKNKSLVLCEIFNGV
jgi:hypothetical protein